MKIFQFVLLALGALGVLFLADRSEAATLYGATAAGAAGELYVLNPSTGAVIQDVGPLNDATGQNYSITGLVFHPVTGVLYGSTSNDDPVTRRKLVTVNPATAQVTVVGNFNVGSATMTDLAFSSAGTMYGIGSSGGPNLHTINFATGQATLVGASGLSNTEGGALAISAAGTFYGNANSASYGTYNSGTGVYTHIVNPTKPVGGSYAALSFGPGGVLYGLDLGPSSTGKPTHLVTIVPGTGIVTDIGASVTQLDAIAFDNVPEPTTTALIFGGVLTGLACRARCRRR